MSLPWDAFGDLDEICEHMRRVAQDALGEPPLWENRASEQPWAPRVDIWETSQSLMFEVELPGVRREDIEIDMDGDRLTIRGVRRAPEGRDFLRAERPSGPFRRSFAIGVPIARGGAGAKYRDGILEITLPKAQEAQRTPIKVPIE